MKKGLISADSIPPFGLKPTTKQKSNRRAARRAPLALRIGLVVLAATLALGVGIIRLSSSSAAGTISLTTIGTPYTQNFDTLASSGTSSTLPTGWEFVEALANANTTYTAGTGSGNAGDTYSFGATASTERAFGGLQSGTLNPTIGASFTNNTGTTVSSLAVSYTGEQWRLGATARVDRLDFQISTDATSVATGTWTDFNALDFTAPVTAGTVGALNGNVAPNRTPVSATIAGLNIPNGATFFVRWTDLNAAGADDGLAVDDFSLTPDIADAAPTVQTTSPNNGATNVAVNSNITINFSEPVNVTGTWFTIVGSLSGSHTASASGGPTSFTLDPTSDFVNNETVTVTIVASQVMDQDTNDPPDLMAADFVFSFSTPVVLICGNPATLIHNIQGSGATSPMAGSIVEIEGIVVGDYQAAGQFSGFFIQEEDSDADADPATSEGIFVFHASTPVSVGDKVRAKGTVFEFGTAGFTLTELTSVSTVTVCSTGNSMPTSTTVTLPVASLTDWERYEGMLINITQDLTVTDNFTLGRFGEVGLSVDGRCLNPTNITTPGAAAIAQQDLNDRRRILLDDANNNQNIDPTLYPTGGLSAFNTLRVGYKVSGGLTGVLDQRFGVYRVQPVGPISFTADNPRPAAPDSVGGTLKVAGLNVLNYFNGNGLGGGFPTSRGAESPAEFTRQRDKIISVITTINPDIAGMSEIENDATPNSAIEDLVAGLNAATAPGTYTFINTGVVGTDEIRVAIIYKPATVSPVGAYAILNSTVDPLFIDTKNRPALAQTFSQISTGAKFTVVVNHLKSKGSDCNDVGDPDTGDGQGNCNLTRAKAATALVNWLGTDPTGSGDPDFLLIGDYNSYAKEDPISNIKLGGYTDLINAFVGPEAYSYQFDGQSGYLDHALASSSLSSQVTGATEFHVNADEPIVLDYNFNFKTANQFITFYDPGAFRASDHDPVVVGLILNAPPTVDAGGPYSVIEGQSVLVSATGSDPNGGTLTYDWDLDNNGSFETPGQNVTFSAAALTAPGTHTIKVRVTDAGGLTATDEATVFVIFGFSGFFTPVDNFPTFNLVKAGASVAIKFSLGGDKGLSIFAAGYPKSEQIACDSTAEVDGTTSTVTAGSSGLTFDPITNQYSYAWKTDKSWANTCRQLVVKLIDGTVHRANFTFK
ncbi:MAG TPA: ExeM/NucH family extracellular endonuclease [Blastocatellia bacterium]|nr:ExeM/NucH family extracellular endonuclease [Blastocatellia bacterium]